MDTALVALELNPRQENFCRIVASGSTLTAAYVEAYGLDAADNAANVAASALARRPHVKAKIAALRAAIDEQFVIKAAPLRMRQLDIATAGALVHTKRYNCRHCFASPPRATQWDDADHFADAVEAYRESLATGGKPLPKPLYGGVDYDPFAPPNPRCRRCRGVGEAFIYGPQDTTELTGAQAAAYAGASIDARTGTIEVHQYDAQDAAKELHRMVPGALAPQKSESKSITVHLEPLKDMTPEQVIEFARNQRLLP